MPRAPRRREPGGRFRSPALGTGSAAGEEFPAFREFWIHSPTDGAVTIHALLDSPSVAGAFQFALTPGDTTVVATRVALFPRRDLAEVGIAPERTFVDKKSGSTTDRPGLRALLGYAHDGDVIVVDGATGTVIRDPDAADLKTHQQRVNA